MPLREYYKPDHFKFTHYPDTNKFFHTAILLKALAYIAPVWFSVLIKPPILLSGRSLCNWNTRTSAITLCTVMIISVIAAYLHLYAMGPF